jgi:hypothetical protein
MDLFKIAFPFGVPAERQTWGPPPDIEEKFCSMNIPLFNRNEKVSKICDFLTTNSKNYRGNRHTVTVNEEDAFQTVDSTKKQVSTKRGVKKYVQKKPYANQPYFNYRNNKYNNYNNYVKKIYKQSFHFFFSFNLFFYLINK